MIIYRFKIICTVRHALRTVNIKALLLHALRRTVVIKYMSLPVRRDQCVQGTSDPRHIF